jgi:hypothetical protein
MREYYVTLASAIRIIEQLSKEDVEFLRKWLGE